MKSNRGSCPRTIASAVIFCTALLLPHTRATGGLMAYWPLDEAAGQTAFDWTTVNNGQLGSTPGADANDPLVNQPGRVGTAYSFDGTNDYVEVPDHATIGANVRSALTLSMWINSAVALSTNGNTYRALEKGDAYFFLQGDGGGLGSGGMNFLIKQGNTNRVVALGESLPAGSWQHLVGTYDAATGQMRIYLNGGLKGSFTAPAVQIDDDHLPLRIGSDDAGKWFNGRIDEVAIYNHVLTPYQIIHLAKGGSPTALPATPPPLITSATRSGGTDPVEPIVMNSLLSENALAYADRTHEWNALPAAHPELAGADYIRIANDDRDAPNFRMNVGLARPATVYLFRDSRLTGTALANMNQWFNAYGFKSTGQSIWLDENGDGSNNTEFYVFRGNFPAGSVDLFAQNTPSALAIYGAAAVEQMPLASAHAYTPVGTNKTFIELAGQAVIEGENYSARALVAGDTDGWFIVPDERPPAGPFVSNARDGKYVQSLPDDQSAGGPTIPPSIEYKVQISTPGQYRLYLRWDGNNTNSTTQGQSDSLFVDVVELKDGAGGSIADWYELQHGIDGNYSTDPWDGTGGSEQNQATPSDNPIVWTIPAPGIYTVRVSQREDGANVDAIVFQLSSLGAPSGLGPAQSAFSIAPFRVLAAYSKLGGDPDAVYPVAIAGGFVEGAPAFVDAPGNWTGIPTSLLGADLVRTESQDAGYGFVDYSLILDHNAYLYILLDDRYIAGHGLPQWMFDLGFQDTNLNVLLDGQTPFSIFQAGLLVPGGVPISFYGLGYELVPAYSFYGIVAADIDLLMIPEPATLSLLAAGALGLALKSRRGRRP